MIRRRRRKRRNLSAYENEHKLSNTCCRITVLTHKNVLEKVV